jgi:flagellin
MSVINTNVSALYSQNALTKNARVQSSTMEQLSTGNRVNSAKDDAAGLAIGQNMTAQVRGLNQAVRNANDAINMLQTAEGAMVEQSNMLQRMRELAVQASNATYSTTQLGYLNTEFQALSTQIDKIATQTTWNGQTLLAASTTAFTYQTGINSGQTITVSIAGTGNSYLGLASSYNTAAGTITTGQALITTQTTAMNAITALDSAIDNINSARATLGATINRMTYATDNMTNIASNVTASRSTIMDTDYATASTQLSKTQIISQAATAMLAQANQQPQSVLSLLK